ncbi:O-antigen ligase family protein [Prosthecobacter fusiformis]|uniref:O-antigen ligase family protein n=1 Tax=Prosthecobacter fusiformis TaxID=48464 RepID=UPI00105C8CDC|nr:hypothetical protein [Prosthecobacter fusiformis]
MMALGWAAVLNPQAKFDEKLMILFPLERPTWSAWLPGTVDLEMAMRSMRRLTGLIGLLWIMLDMARESGWRKAIIWTVTLTGCSVAAHGIAQKTAGDVWNYWEGRTLPITVFAGFWYHANAAALLNLCWPFVAALTLESFARGRNQLKRALLMAGILLMMAAVIVNVSKAGHMLFAVLIVVWIGLVLPSFLRSVTGVDEIRRPLMITTSLMILAGGGLALAFGADKAHVRWQEMSMKRMQTESRYASARFCLGELPRAGLTGFGPGTFEAVFLDVGTTHPEKVPDQRWRFAHQDTLQTLLEWGWLGGGLWIAIGLGALRAAYRSMHQLRQPFFSSRHVFQAAAFTSLTGVALHAQMDFPLQILGVQVIVVAVVALGMTVPDQQERRRSRTASSEGKIQQPITA